MPTQTQVADSTTQLFLDIHDITNNLVIMKDGTTSVIITVDAMNFGLLAEEEQDGIIYAYAGLLNSLNYPIQIVIRSQTKDVTQYLTLLKEQEDLAPNRLMQHRIRTYREFVSNLIQERNVLDKKFYVVIPASAIELGLLAPSTVLPGSKPLDLFTVERSVLLEKAKSILEPKKDHLIAQFARIGLLARELETQEIIQLFYMSYNPEAAEGQEITDSNSYTTPLVKAGMQEAAPVLTQQSAAPTQQETETTSPPQESPLNEPTVVPAQSEPASIQNQVAPVQQTIVLPQAITPEALNTSLPTEDPNNGFSQLTTNQPAAPQAAPQVTQAPLTPQAPATPQFSASPLPTPITSAPLQPQLSQSRLPETPRPAPAPQPAEQEIFAAGASFNAPSPTTLQNQNSPLPPVAEIT